MTIAMFVLACVFVVSHGVIALGTQHEDWYEALFGLGFGAFLFSAMALAVLAIVRFFMEVI